MRDNGTAQVLRNLNRWHEEKRAGIEAVGKLTAQEMARYSKRADVAKWTDRTGNARQGLKGGFLWRNKLQAIIYIAHRVTYGVHLELGFGKRFADLQPTVNKFRVSVISKLKRIMEA